MEAIGRGGILPGSGGTALDGCLERARSGDAAAFEALVFSISPMLANGLRRLLGSDEDAVSAAVQDAWTSAWQQLDVFEDGSHLVCWLHRVAKCRGISGIRKVRPRVLTSWAESGDGAPCIPVPASRVSERVATEIEPAVRAAIANLPDTYRGIATLHFIHGQRPREVGLLLGLGLSTVKMRLHRARRRLRRTLRGVEPP